MSCHGPSCAPVQEYVVVVSHEGFRRLTLPLRAVSSAKQPERSSEWGKALPCTVANLLGLAEMLGLPKIVPRWWKSSWRQEPA